MSKRLFNLIIVICIVDLITTYFCLKIPGTSETNPYIAILHNIHPLMVFSWIIIVFMVAKTIYLLSDLYDTDVVFHGAGLSYYIMSAFAVANNISIIVMH